ncbi:hypothetical protein D3C71_1387840 [compost metagenome]
MLVISPVAASICPTSSALLARMVTPRSPRATDLMACTAWPSGRVMMREIMKARPAATSDSSSMQLMMAITLVRWVALASASLAVIRLLL